MTTRQTRNFDCTPCHGTGFLWSGGSRGFDDVRRLMKVGCEACHGPVRAHVEHPDAPFDGAVPRARCEGCHRAQDHQARTFMSFGGLEFWGRVMDVRR